MDRQKTVIIFHSLGPYHLARLAGAAKYQDITAIELSASTKVYEWERSQLPDSFEIRTLSKDIDSRDLNLHTLRQLLENALNEIKPKSVFINGWSDRGALLSFLWCKKNNTPVFAMSESNAFDFKRKPLTEWVKTRIVKNLDGALVGGETHAAYLVELGLEGENIRKGYDVVDNAFFSATPLTTPKKKDYILTSCRFIPKKNLLRLLDAYAIYKSEAENLRDLIILGDGDLKEQVTEKIKEKKLEGNVHLPGFKQIDDLPGYYANAACFILPSTREQWGLVVNEAMAAGLPVLVSDRVGSAHELVSEGQNGYTFDPFSTAEIAEALLKTDASPEQLSSMGRKSREIIAEYSPDLFGKSVAELNELSSSKSRQKASVFDTSLVGLLCYLYN